ncbi:MAG: ferritin-like domain-containing protein [Alphaproteobacteria bacterium]|nr:ferritin-like domain-containing protein [Alphaproteobacteria bacterium]
MSPDHSSLLRARLLAAIGLLGVSGLNNLAEGQDSGAPEVACVTWTAESECPSGEDALERLQDGVDTACAITQISNEGVYSEDSEACCYEVVLNCVSADTGFKSLEGCCYGRPYVAEGQARLAAVTRQSAWLHRRLAAPRVLGLSDETRRALAAKWSRDGQAEHSSIAGFHRFALELMAHGAPPELIARAQLAAAQELEHARLCFALASAYAGEPLGPGPLPIGDAAPIARDLVELAVSTATDGAIGEALAAHGAAVALSRVTDPAVRHVLSQIVEEESAHAELAWATLRWALEAGGEPVRAALASVFEALSEEISEGPDPEGLQEHGVLGTAERQEARQACVRRVLRPAARALLGLGVSAEAVLQA